MAERGKDQNRVRVTLEGHVLWAFRRFEELTGKNDSAAFTAIVDRWLDADREFAERHDLTLAAYRKAMGKAEVVPMFSDKGLPARK